MNIRICREWLKEIRLDKGVSQGYISKKAGCSRQYYNMIELGVRGGRMPVSTAKKIADVLNFDWTRFYEDE